MYVESFFSLCRRLYFLQILLHPSSSTPSADTLSLPLLSLPISLSLDLWDCGVGGAALVVHTEPQQRNPQCQSSNFGHIVTQIYFTKQYFTMVSGYALQGVRFTGVIEKNFSGSRKATTLSLLLCLLSNVAKDTCNDQV